MDNKELEILKDKQALGTLSEAENASLEVEMLQNPNLENELNIHIDLVKGVQYAGELEIQEMLDKIHYQHSTVNPPKSKQKFNLYYIAGLLLILLSLAYLLFETKVNDKVENSRLYAELYSQYQPSLQGRGTSKNESIISFNRAYVEKDYDLALTIIKPFLKESKNSIKLTAAIAANEVDDLILAESLLNEIVKSEDYYFLDHALWYKALIKLKKNETSSIKEILNPIITNPKTDHHKEALELISKLNG